MYRGKMTKELDKLYGLYYEKFGDYPYCYDDLEYSESEYDDYVNDIKKAIEKNKELPYVADVGGDDYK